MTLPTDYRTLSSTSPRGLRQHLPPMRLWQKAKRLGIWNPMDIDLTQDKIDWQGLKAEEDEVNNEVDILEYAQDTEQVY